MNKLCVIIPVHKPYMSSDEMISLEACNRQLSRYDCYLVFPDGMNIDEYVSAFKSLRLKGVNPVWLSSVQNYNRMKLDMAFYEMFRAYNFMLTYELDAYIFHSDFDQTNAFAFDYIGAPFFEGYLSAGSNAPFIKGGNSGFSIRNIQSCIQVLKSIKVYYTQWLLYKHVYAVFPRITYHLNAVTKMKNDVFLTGKLAFHFSTDHYNEDLVWSQFIPVLFRSFKVADPISSLQFSFEHNPEQLYELNKNQLPLGCHAWPKYAYFWRKYINNCS